MTLRARRGQGLPDDGGGNQNSKEKNLWVFGEGSSRIQYLAILIIYIMLWGLDLRGFIAYQCPTKLGFGGAVIKRAI